MVGIFQCQIGHSARAISLLIALFFSSLAFTAVEQAEAGNGKKLLQLHNRERLKRKIPRLRRRGPLTKAAQSYAQVMAENDHFSHVGPDGSTFSERIKRETRSLHAMGENLALGQKDAKLVHKAWMRSKTHRRNILNRNFRYVGFGKAGDEPFWATSFGG